MRFSIFFLFFTAITLLCQTDLKYSGFVNDSAFVLPYKDKIQLEKTLSALQSKTGIEFAVVTVESLEGLSVEQYSLKLFEDWKIGKKGKDNGLLLLLSVSDRKIRLETGYGLEGTINDGKAGAILDRAFLPSARQGKLDRGLINAVSEVLSELGYEDSVLKKNVSRKKENSLSPVSVTIFSGIFFIAFMILFFYNPSLAVWLLLQILSGSHSRRHGRSFGSGGSFRSFGGGSGGSSFSGFGGGRSGGGGASRGW